MLQIFRPSFTALFTVLLCGILLPTSLPVQAQSNRIKATANELIEDWSAWMERHKITKGAIAIAYNGTPIASHGIGRTPDDPAPVASLSKSITAVCTLKLLQEKGLPPKIRLPKAMPQFFNRFRARDKRLFDITLADLMTHDSGIQTNYISREYPKFKTLQEEQKELQLRHITRERLENRPGRNNYAYSNANYLILGAAIEEISQEDYETYCAKTVLAPLGITTARLSEEWKVLSAFGGWEISASDFLTFINAYFKDGQIMGQSPTRYAPKVHIGNNRYYGPGVLFRRTDKGALFWHAGSWRWKTDIIDARFGAYFLMLDDGLSISINYNHDAFDGQLSELEEIIWTRTH